MTGDRTRVGSEERADSEIDEQTGTGGGAHAVSDDGLLSGVLSPRARAILLTYGLALLGFGVGVVLLTALAVVYLSTGRNITVVTELGMSLIALQGIAFPVVSISFLYRRGLDWSFLHVHVPSLRDIGWSVLTFVGAFALALAGVIVIQTLNLETASNTAAEAARQNPAIIPYLIVAMLLLVGPGEELLFRGVIQRTLRDYFSAPAAILLASGAFAPLHIFALVGNLQAGLVSIGLLFLPSIVFGYAYERTGNLFVPALGHGIYNSFLLILLYLATSYAPEAQNVLGT